MSHAPTGSDPCLKLFQGPAVGMYVYSQKVLALQGTPSLSTSLYPRTSYPPDLGAHVTPLEPCVLGVFPTQDSIWSPHPHLGPLYSQASHLCPHTQSRPPSQVS
jgi:hypothetical protein